MGTREGIRGFGESALNKLLADLERRDVVERKERLTVCALVYSVTGCSCKVEA